MTIQLYNHLYKNKNKKPNFVKIPPSESIPRLGTESRQQIFKQGKCVVCGY
jgi:hypothetical protein